MSETSLDRIISETHFAQALTAEAEMFFRLANTLQHQPDPAKARQHLYQLGIEADLVEAFLDDHGAKHNRSFCFLRELVASIRGFSRVGFCLEHLQNRLDSYDTLLQQAPTQDTACKEAIFRARHFTLESIHRLLGALRLEAKALGVQWGDKLFPEDRYTPGLVNIRLPHNLGDELIEEEGRKTAEVASKYLQVCTLFGSLSIRRLEDAGGREKFLSAVCTEERARVYEATVHNLQSAYDTYIKGTTLEAGDPRLHKMRGHVSAAFHLLEAVTGLTHFVERHEVGLRSDDQKRRMGEFVSRTEVRDITLNSLLFWANEILVLGEPLAREILSSFSNVQELQLLVPEGVTIHARPASLIVAVVNHYEMPVEMEVAGKTCNAASILEVLISAGSNPRETTYAFRGDSRPLQDLRALFEAGLGEKGLHALPDSLSYLVGE
jgi:phosphotransferase system HPr (HPr) family protein